MAKKKAARKKTSKRFLENVPQDKVFWLIDGRDLWNLKDLQAVLPDMSSETFQHHVNKERNDFKNWIHFVIGDKTLAKDIAKTKTKKTLMNKLNKRIKKLGK